MKKQEILIQIEQYLILNEGDPRLLSSFKKDIEKIFDKFNTAIPIKYKTIKELNHAKKVFTRCQTNSLLSDKIKAILREKIEQIDLIETSEFLLEQEQEIKNLAKTLDSVLEELIRLNNERV